MSSSMQVLVQLVIDATSQCISALLFTLSGWYLLPGVTIGISFSGSDKTVNRMRRSVSSSWILVEIRPQIHDAPRS